MIWVIGGTSEASELADRIDGKAEYVITVATYSGKEVLGKKNVVVSRLDGEAMSRFMEENTIECIVDVSHPYAIEVSKNARLAAQRAGIRYIRYVREKASIEGALCFPSFDSLMEYIKGVKGTVLFTTGMKNIGDFQGVRNDNRFIYRVLPTLFSIEECVKNNVKMADIIAVLGPLSKELNEAMFKEYSVDYVVMKDSGRRGGTEEKIEACRELGVTPLVVVREEEDGVYSIDELLEMIL